MSTWIPLRLHSQYSILDSTISIKSLVQKALQDNMSALALTDSGNLFGAVEFYQACAKAGIKPLIGAELFLAPQGRHEKKKVFGQKHASAITLIAKNAEGYANLCKLSSIGYLEGFYYLPRIDKEVLAQYSAGLCCLSGNVFDAFHPFLEEKSSEAIDAEIEWYLKHFGEDFYLELQRHKMTQTDLHNDEIDQESWLLQKYQSYIQEQNQLNDFFVDLAKRKNLPFVATNNSRYLEKEEWRAHEILLNVQLGECAEIWERDSEGRPKFKVKNPKRRAYASHELYFKTQKQMQELFKDLPEALSQTVDLANKCELELDFQTKHYPVFYPPEIEKGSLSPLELQSKTAAFLEKLCQDGIEERYTLEALEKVKEKYPEKDPLEVVKQRLKTELSIIIPKGLADYLLIVWDFIHWAKKQGIPVGPGRGSGAGSIVLYLIGVTDIEPLRFDLFFERFINPERMSYPDIDVDICMSKRGQVIDYTIEKYGQDCVAQIITFGTMKAKMAVKDVGRVLNVPLPKINQLAKLIPDDLNITIEKALEVDTELNEFVRSDEEIKRVVELGRQVEGSIRNTGIHAAGVIISGQPLSNLIPICRAKDAEMAVTQFSMKPVEAVGMLKVDFLGLKTLTCIQLAVEAVRQSHQVEIDWMNLELEDEQAFNLLNQGKTLGVFQMESAGMQELAKNLHLDRFEEIIAVLALYRPGPMDMIPSFIDRKHGKEEIQYDHPWMQEILSETYGIMVYQEQVMQIAQKLANYSLGEGDVLRRAMGKKDMQQMTEQREKFKEGAIANDISAEDATKIFDKMEKFAAYGFNKSHAAAYGYLTYVTAYLKANYPGEWLAALMTCDRDDLTKVSKFIRESQAMGINILSPDINEAGNQFTAHPKGIRFAMSGVKGVGSGVVDVIINERQAKGPFQSLFDFIKRIDHSKVGKKLVENLIFAGAFDFTNWPRTAMVDQLDAMYQEAQKESLEKKTGVISLFSLLEEQEPPFVNPPFKTESLSKPDLLFKEKFLLGFFLTGHPMALYEKLISSLSCSSLKQVLDIRENTVVRSAFIIEEVKTRNSAKTGRKFAILKVSDGLQNIELPVWPELYEKKGHILTENRMVYSVLKIESKEGETRLTCCWLEDLTQIQETQIRECDEAYDKAKFQLERASKLFSKSASPRSANTREKMSKPKVTEVKEQLVNLHFDVDRLKLSHIIKLKELITHYQGQQACCLRVNKAKQNLACLHIDEKLKIELNASFKEALAALPSFEGLSIDEK